jgi:hypothetical protein
VKSLATFRSVLARASDKRAEIIAKRTRRSRALTAGSCFAFISYFEQRD